MNKRLLLLNGLAIIAVIVSHVAGWGQGIMTSEKWQSVFLAIGLKGFDRFPGIAYNLTTIIRMLANFAVPSFFFVTGFFIAYAERGSDTSFSYRVVFARIGRLMIPYTIWSVVLFAIGRFVFNDIFSPIQYLWIFFSIGAELHLYYVPALILFYLVIPPLLPLIHRRPLPAVVIAAFLQIGLVIFNWMTTYRLVTINLPDPFSVQPWFPTWWVSKWVLFGTLGIICGFAPLWFSKFLEKNKKLHFGAAFLLFLLLASVELAARLTDLIGFELAARLTEIVYGVFFILFFLSSSVEKSSIAKVLYWLSGRIYGIYMLHYPVLIFLAHGLGLVIPFMLGYQILYQPILFAVSLAIPILAMQFVSRTPLRRYYRYLFG